MNARRGPGWLPAVMLALAALVHVQWAAACDHHGGATERHGSSCCAGHQHESGMTHCPDRMAGDDCSAPFLKSASAARPADGDAGADRPPPAPVVALSPRPDAGLRVSRSHRLLVPASAVTFGRTLYLTSGRLRL